MSNSWRGFPKSDRISEILGVEGATDVDVKMGTRDDSKYTTKGAQPSTQGEDARDKQTVTR